MGASKEEPTKYVRGTNEYLDAIIGDDVVYIVNRNKGRRPVSANQPPEGGQSINK